MEDIAPEEEAAAVVEEKMIVTSSSSSSSSRTNQTIPTFEHLPVDLSYTRPKKDEEWWEELYEKIPDAAPKFNVQETVVVRDIPINFSLRSAGFQTS